MALTSIFNGIIREGKAKKKELWMAFVDLEKAFDRVPQRDCVVGFVGCGCWVSGLLKPFKLCTMVQLRQSN